LDFSKYKKHGKTGIWFGYICATELYQKPRYQNGQRKNGGQYKDVTLSEYVHKKRACILTLK
jgi:hypothetical protein